MTTNPIVWVILASIACSVGGQLSLKAGMNQVGRIGRRHRGRWRAGLPLLTCGLAFYGVSTLLWLYVLARVDLSFAFPFLSLSFVAILFGARWGLGESMARTRLIGSAIIVLGVLLVSSSQPSEDSDPVGLAWQDSERPVLLVLDTKNPERTAGARWADLLTQSFGAIDVQPVTHLLDRPGDLLAERRLVVVPHDAARDWDASVVELLDPWVRRLHTTLLVEAPNETLAAALGLRVSRVEERAKTPWPYDARSSFLTGAGLPPPPTHLKLPWKVWRYAPAAAARPGIRSTSTIARRPANWTRPVGEGAWMILNVDLAEWVDEALQTQDPQVQSTRAPWIDVFVASVLRSDSAAGPWPRLSLSPPMRTPLVSEEADRTVARPSCLPWRSRDHRGRLLSRWTLSDRGSPERIAWNAAGFRSPLAASTADSSMWSRPQFDRWWRQRNSLRWTWKWEDPWLTVTLESPDSVTSPLPPLGLFLPRQWNRRALADWTVTGSRAVSERGWLFSRPVLRIAVAEAPSTIRVRYRGP